MLNEREAWQEAASRIEGRIRSVCGVIANLQAVGLISDYTSAVMRAKVESVTPEPGCCSYRWPLNVEGCRKRVEYCLEQARLLDAAVGAVPESAGKSCSAFHPEIVHWGMTCPLCAALNEVTRVRGLLDLSRRRRTMGEEYRD